MRSAAAARSLLPLPLPVPAGAAPIHTPTPPLTAELDASDALHALLSTLPPSLPALLPCLSLLSHRLTPHSIADALLCAELPLASRLRLFLFSALSPRLRSPLLHSRAVVPILHATDADAAMYDAIADAQAAGLQPPVAAFEALVFANASANRCHEAVEAFSRMEAEFGCRPTTFAYNAVLRALVNSGVVPLTLALYNRMVADGCLPNRATYNVLLDCLCKRGAVADALKLFDEMVQRGILPNVKTYTILLSSMCNSGQLKEAENLLHTMKDKGCPPDEAAYNAFFSGLCKAGRVDEAIERLEALRRTGAFVLGLKGYSCLIDGLFLAGRYDEGFRCYREMLEQTNVSPDVVLYTIMIRGCTEAGRTKDAFMLFVEMKEKGFAPDTFCYNTLLKALCDAGDLDGARLLRSEMAQNNVVLDTTTHTIMICGLCQRQLVDEAMQVLDEMGKVGCHPTVMTYNVLINGLYKAHRLDEAQMLWYKMEMGNNPSLYLRLGANQVRDSESLQKLVDSMCQSGQVLKAYKLLRGIIDSGVVPDVVTYNTLINGLCKVRKIDQALSLFENLQAKGFSLDEMTYGTLIDSLLRAHRDNEAMALFHRLLQSGGTPSLSIYNSMMRHLCRMQKLSQAVNLWFDHLPRKYNLSAEDEVSASARKKFENGSLDEAVRDLIKIDQEHGSVNSSPYTIWLIGLCQARRIDEALKIFYTLEEFGMDITPACCSFLTKYLCWERNNLDSALDVMLYTLSRRFIMSRPVGNRLLRSLCIHHRRKDAQALAWRMHLVGYDMDEYLREATKRLLYSQ